MAHRDRSRRRLGVVLPWSINGAGLEDGTVKVVVSTNALELGIDIGALDVAVLVGYPGSQASLWQRAGRIGRRGNASLVVQIAGSEPVDQYLAHHPGVEVGDT